MIDNRRYLIESVGKISGDVSMRDVTFQNNVGFPINRWRKSLIRSSLSGKKNHSKKTESPQRRPRKRGGVPAWRTGIPYDHCSGEDTFGRARSMETEKIRYGGGGCEPLAPCLSADAANRHSRLR